MELNERVFGGPMGDRIKWFQSAIAWGPRVLSRTKKERESREATSEFNAEFFSLHAKLGLQATMLNGESR